MTIDPYEVIIKYLLSKSSVTDLVGTRISVKHKYGGTWDPADVGLVVVPNSGPPDIYLPVQDIGIQMRIYAANVEEGMSVWKALVDLSRATERETVAVTGGNGFLFYLLPTSAPGLVTDGDLNKDILLVNFTAKVGEGAI